MVPAPGPAAQRVVARPGDGREGGEDAVPEHDTSLDDPREVRDRFTVVFEPLLQLGIAQPVQQEYVDPLGPSAVSFLISHFSFPRKHLLDHPPVLSLEIDIRRHSALARSAAARVLPVDQW